MARVTNLGINIFSHWNGRGMRQARRNLRQIDKTMNSAEKEAKQLSRSTNRLDRANKLLARSLKRPHKNLRMLGSAMNDADRDSNRFRRGLHRLGNTLRRLGGAVRRPTRGIRLLGRWMGQLGDGMVRTASRGRALSFVFRGLLLRAALALAPALLPIINYLAGIAVEATAMSAAAVIGFGGFAAAMFFASKRALEFRGRLNKASKSQREHIKAVDGARKAWNKFLDSKIGGKLLVPMNIALRAITRNMHKLKPLVNAIAPIIRNIARRFADWMDRSNGFRRFVRVMKKDGVPIMRNLAAAARSVLKFLGRAFRDSLPGARKLSRAIRRGARALANWAAEGGFKRWLNKTKKDGPKVRKFFRELKKLAPKLLEAIRDMAPVSLKLATAFLKIANNLSPGQIRALMWAFILAKPALVAFRLASAGVNGALWLLRRRSRRAGDAIAGAGGKAKKSKGRFQGLKNVLKKVGRGALSAGSLIFFAPKSLGKGIGKVIGKISGKLGLNSVLGKLLTKISPLLGRMGLGGLAARAGVAGAALGGGGGGLIGMAAAHPLAAAAIAAAAAIGFLAVKTNLGDWILDAFRNTVGLVQDVLADLGEAARDAAGFLSDLASDAWSAITPWHDGGGEEIRHGGAQVRRLGDNARGAGGNLRGLNEAASGAVGQARNLGGAARGAGNGVRGLSDSSRRSLMNVRDLGGGLDRSVAAARDFAGSARGAGNGARNLGQGAGRARGPLARLAAQTGFSKKELKNMGIGADDARKMLNQFGQGAVNTGRQVDRQAGGAFRNGAKNLRRNWGGATNFVRRTTRSRLLKTIHQTRAFRNKIGRVFNGIKKDIKKAWGKTFDGLARTAKRKFNAAEKQAKQFKKTVGRQFHQTAKAMRKHWGKATESVRDNARKDFNKAVGRAKQFKKDVGKQFHQTAKAIRKHWGKATESVRDNARKDFNKAVGRAKDFRKSIGRQFHQTANAIRKHWGKATESVRDNARKDFNKAVGRARNFRRDVERVFNKLGNNIKKSWTNALDDVKTRARKRLSEVRKGIEAALKKIKKAFDETTDGIKKIWQGRLPAIFKKPVKFFVEVVYNKGLRKAWNNTFANLPGIKELKGANVPFRDGGEVKPANQYASGGLAQRGGRVRGPGGPTADKIPADLSSGEYVIRAKAVKQIGVDVLNRINTGVGGDLPKRGVPRRDGFKRKSVADSHFADGGMIGSRMRHNRCSAYAPMKFAEGGFIPWPTVDIGEVRSRAVANGIKAAKKSKMLGSTAGVNFGSGNMSNGDDSQSGFDWGTNLYQDVASKVAKKVLHPFMNTAFRAANGPFRPAGDWAEVSPQYLKGIMSELISMIVAAANVGCGTNGFAPFRPWKSGDGAVSSFRGVRLDRRTKQMCQASEKKLGKRMSYFQGSFSHASASAGTHAGGGAVDTGPASFRTSAAMRASGFAAWARGSQFGSGSFSPHVHGIAVGNKNLSGPARAQVKAFMNGRDGLAGNRPDNQPGGGGSCMMGGSGVKRWAPLACTALKLGGCGCSPNKLREFLDLMRQESGGNPRATNNWDSNAAAGNASRGLMQVIPTTFRANHVRGTSNNIFDPLANMAASVRYIKRQYGCRIPNAPYAQGGLVLGRPGFCSGGGVGMLPSVQSKIFDTGGTLRPGINLVNNRTGGPEELKRVRNGDSHGCDVTVNFNGPVIGDKREMRETVIKAVAEGKRRHRI